jgi:hypothetical protein
MQTVPRPKKTAPRSRCATPLELADEARRWERAREAQRAPTPAPETQSNLCAVLVTFAAWRRCCTCQSLVLYVNANARATGDVECPTCIGVREDLAKRLRRPSLPMRAALHLRALFATSNDNHEART